jgi:hypothetical protein
MLSSIPVGAGRIYPYTFGAFAQLAVPIQQLSNQMAEKALLLPVTDTCAATRPRYRAGLPARR